MALDAYLKIDGIDGESQATGHQNWIQLLEFDHKIKQSATSVGGGPGATVGRSDHADLRIRKALDKATPKIMQACCSGQPISTVTVDLMRADGNNSIKGLEITLENVFVSNVSPSGSSTGDEFPSEWISFNYGVIKWSYTPQQQGTTAVGAINGGWDVVQRRIATP